MSPGELLAVDMARKSYTSTLIIEVAALIRVGQWKMLTNVVTIWNCLHVGSTVIMSRVKVCWQIIFYLVNLLFTLFVWTKLTIFSLWGQANTSTVLQQMDPAKQTFSNMTLIFSTIQHLKYFIPWKCHILDTFLMSINNTWRARSHRMFASDCPL